MKKRGRLPQDIPLPPTTRPIIIKFKLIVTTIYTTLIEKATILLEKVKYRKRTNLLNKKDILKIYLNIRKGDIILAGNLKSPTNFLIPGSLTHAGLYSGHQKVIHAIGNGVESTSLQKILKTYDTLAILRLPKKIPHRRHLIKKAIRYAKLQLGLPYESFFHHHPKHFFCTELVNKAYHHAGYRTGLHNLKPFRTSIEKVEKEFIEVTHWLKPIEFLHGNFRLVFLSHNLAYNGKEILIRTDKI